MHIFNQVSGPVLQLWAQLSDDSCWQIVFHQSRSTCPRQDIPPPDHTHPATLFSSRPEWIWGLTQPYKTNNTSAGTSVSKAASQLTFELTVVHQLSITSASSVVAFPWKQSVSSLCQQGLLNIPLNTLCLVVFIFRWCLNQRYHYPKVVVGSPVIRLILTLFPVFGSCCPEEWGQYPLGTLSRT